MNKKLEDKVIMDEVLRALNLNALQLSKDLDYKSHNSVYNVLRGYKNLNKDMINRLMIKYPQLSYVYLLKGIGEPLLQGNRVTNQNNVFRGHEPENPFEAILNIPARLDEIEANQLKIENLLIEIKNHLVK